MALSQQDKDCINGYHTLLTRPGAHLDATQEAHLVDILEGDEAARVAAAKYYASTHILPGVQAQLAAIDQRKTDLQAQEASLVAYTA